MATPGEWFASLPPLTRLYGASCFAATLATQLGLVSPYALVLFWKPVFSELQARTS
jgi:Derlin-2/3